MTRYVELGNTVSHDLIKRPTLRTSADLLLRSVSLVCNEISEGKQN